MRIRFIDEHGMEEAGIDGGGLFKDFMENLVKEVRFGLVAVTLRACQTATEHRPIPRLTGLGGQSGAAYPHASMWSPS